jgi:hypothetical protein
MGSLAMMDAESFFSDLSPYRYRSTGLGERLLNVGWLARGHAFPVGQVPNEFVDRLWEYCNVPVMQTRGTNGCELCTPPDYGLIHTRHGAQTLELGTAEVWVFGAASDRIYAAPDLIFHYVTTHGYQPPSEFVDAVLRGKDPTSPEYLAALGELNLPDMFAM